MRKSPLERSYDLEAKSKKQKTHRLITGFFVRFHCCDVSRTRSVAYSFSFRPPERFRGHHFKNHTPSIAPVNGFPKKSENMQKTR